MFVAVRPPRSGIGRILGFPIAIITVIGVPLGFFSAVFFEGFMIIPYRTILVATNEMMPPTTEAIAIPTNIPPLDLSLIHI
jgi:hypothetical protein